MATKGTKRTARGADRLNGRCAFDEGRICGESCQWYAIKPGRQMSGRLTLSGRCVVHEIKDLLDVIAGRIR
ncbi:MAG: hypothetical protein MUF78_02525 [Candidatus Edwardsbacteria bacterium]|jgi:hypothetical protein|nr:hypothetical protein [Candidatus Edwardsbacteria bacterium]